MNTKLADRQAILSVKDSRRTCKISVRFLVNGEAEEIKIGNWTTEYAGRFLEGVALNIDTGGMLIAVNPDKIPYLGKRISAIFQLIGVNEKVMAEGEVVWTNKHSTAHPSGFAIKFADISINAKELREGIDRSYHPESTRINGASLMNIPD